VWVTTGLVRGSGGGGSGVTFLARFSVLDVSYVEVTVAAAVLPVTAAFV